MRLEEDPDDIPFQINIVPMIDVIFAILTFFIMSTLFLTNSQGLPVNLPKAVSSQSQSQNQINVTINQTGQLLLNRQPINLDTLQTQVRSLMGKNQQALVIVNADEQVTHGKVVAVMDKLRLIPGVKLAIATTKP